MFSSAGLIVTKLRNKLSSEVVDQIIFLNKNKIKVPRNEPHITESWLTCNVKPIYKNKGNHLDPNNFRPITILSCFGKLFTAVLLTRLNAFSEKFSILNENQSGFRKGYSTIDNIFAKKEKVIVTFVDFEKAFDKVWRDGLWCKLLLNNINGKMYKLIYNMYQNIKSRIVYNNAVSDFFRL